MDLFVKNSHIKIPVDMLYATTPPFMSKILMPGNNSPVGRELR